MIDVHKISTNCTRNEFVGTAVLDTIGLVISGIDDDLEGKVDSLTYLSKNTDNRDESLFRRMFR